MDNNDRLTAKTGPGLEEDEHCTQTGMQSETNIENKINEVEQFIQKAMENIKDQDIERDSFGANNHNGAENKNAHSDKEECIYQSAVIEKNEDPVDITKSAEYNNTNPYENPANAKITIKQWLLMLGSILVRSYRVSMSGAFAVYYVQFLWYYDVGRTAASWMRTLEQIVSVIVGFGLGAQLDLIQPRYILSGSVFTMVVGLLASSFAPNIITLTWLYGVLVGCGNACINSAITVITQHSFRGKSHLAANLELIGASLGIMISPVVAQALVDEYGWRWTMRLHAVLGLNLVAIAWLMRTPRTRTASQIKQDESITEAQKSCCQKFLDNMKGMVGLFTNIPFMLATLSNVLYLFGMMTFTIHTASRIVTLGYSPKTGSLVLSFTAAVNLVTRLAVLPCTGRLNPFITSAVARLFCACALFLCTFNNSLGYQLGAQFIYGIGMGLSSPLMTVINVELIGLKKLGRATTLHNLGRATAVFCGSSLTAYLYEVSGSYTLPYLLVGGLSALSALILILIFVSRRCEWNEQDWSSWTVKNQLQLHIDHDWH